MLISIERLNDDEPSWLISFEIKNTKFYLELFDDGSDDEPIVFTRMNPEGSEYFADSWSGTIPEMGKKISEILNNI